jgi:hypothetical protein
MFDFLHLNLIALMPNLKATFYNGRDCYFEFSFLLLTATSTVLTDFTPLERGLKLVCNVNTVYGKFSRLCPETSTKLHVHEFGLRCCDTIVLYLYVQYISNNVDCCRNKATAFSGSKANTAIMMSGNNRGRGEGAPYVY